MNCYDVRSVINKKPRKNKVPSEIIKCYNLYKKMLKENKIEDCNELDLFVAGYILANPIIRGQLNKVNEENKKYVYDDN